MKFSLCIPNFNYAHFLGQTVSAVLAQADADFEIVIADNCSTDASCDVVRAFNDHRIRLKVNACNVGFARNLDMAASMAQGEWLIMLSSDDLILPGSLATYRTLIESFEAPDHTVVSSAWNVIDPQGAHLRVDRRDPLLWRDEDLDSSLTKKLDAPVYKVAADVLLSRCLETMRNPFNFAATAYPRALYRQVEGYGGARSINPDKWYHWRLLSVAKTAVFVDKPLFAYRWHPNNQTANERKAGALKYMVDEYANTFELDTSVLKKTGITREQLERSFIEHDVARHGLATLADESSERARRILLFGAATYPKHAGKNWKVWTLAGLIALGPVGKAIAKEARKRFGR